MLMLNPDFLNILLFVVSLESKEAKKAFIFIVLIKLVIRNDRKKKDKNVITFLRYFEILIKYELFRSLPSDLQNVYKLFSQSAIYVFF